MSKKLTPQHIVYSTIQYEDGTHDNGNDYDVYDKEEVDAVLAEKDAKHEAELDKWYAKLCRNRWRRAYAMFQYCSAMNRLECDASTTTMTMHQFWRYHTAYWPRWMKRWLKVYLEYKDRIG